jgi:hypothetical protein
MTGSHEKITLVLAVLIVHDNNDLSIANGLNGFWDGVQHLHGAKVGCSSPNNCPNFVP